MESRVAVTMNVPLNMVLPPTLQHLENEYKMLWAALLNFKQLTFQQLADGLPLVAARDSENNTVLHFAAAVGNPDSLCYVLNRSDDVPPIDALNSNGYTALQIALMNICVSGPDPKYREVVRLLLEAGSDPRLPSESNAVISAAQVKCPDTIRMLYSVIDEVEPNKRNLMMELRLAAWTFQHFVWTGDLQLLRLLIEYEMGVPSSLQLATSPLHNAIEVRAPAEVFGLLLNKFYLNPNGTIDGETLNTPLHKACKLAGQWDNVDVVETLLKWGGNPNTINIKGRNCLHLAAKAGSDPVVKLLIKNDVDMDSWDSAGKNAMLYAAMSGSVQVIKTLASAGLSAFVRCRSDVGASTVHLASRFCHPEAVEFLIIRMGLNPNARDLLNQTPLNHAVRRQASNLDRRCAETIDILVDCGADLYDELYGNTSALRHCLKRNYLHNASIIMRHLAISKPTDKILNDYYMNTINENKILKDMFEACLAEIELLKQTEVDGWITLYNIVALPKESMRPLMRNIGFRKKMNSWIIDNTICRKFPLYSSRIIGRYTFFEKEQRRVNFAKESLSNLIGFGEPNDEIICKIFQYLGPKDADRLYEYKLQKDAESFIYHRLEKEPQ